LLGGGPARGTSTLITGPAGAGKTSLALQYIAASCSRGEHCAIYQFDERIGTLLARAKAFGIDLQKFIDDGCLVLRQLDAAEVAPGQFAAMVREQVEEHDAKVVLIDSLNGYLAAMPQEQQLILQLHELLAFLNQAGVVTVLVNPQQGFFGNMGAHGLNVSYVADVVILLRFFEAEGRTGCAKRGMTEAGSHYGGNMQVYLYDQAGGAKLTIDSVRFLYGNAETNTGGLYVTGWGTVVVTNSLFAGNTAGQTPAASINLTGPLHFTNNTVTGNTANAADTRPIFYAYAHGSSHFWFSDNIFWGNDNASSDLYLYDEGTYDLVSNDIGSYSPVPLGAASGGNVSVDPQFAGCGFLCFDKPLKRSSPLVDAGNDTPPGGLTATDALGVPRVIGTHVDMGAYELDRLFADGFDPSIFD